MDNYLVFVESVQKLIVEKKKANPNLPRDFENSETFIIGVEVGMEAIYQYLTNKSEFVKSNSSDDK